MLKKDVETRNLSEYRTWLNFILNINKKKCNFLFFLEKFDKNSFNPSRPNPGRREKIKLNFSFNTTFRNTRVVKG